MNRLLTFNYSGDFSPPFPAVEIEVDGYGEAPPMSVFALVDSGVDSTMLPLEILQAVNATYRESKQMRGVAGGVQIVDRYLVAISIGPYIVPAIHAIAYSHEALIGRDVLNELTMTLNGPANMIEIHL